jgi:hypothetical protein
MYGSVWGGHKHVPNLYDYLTALTFEYLFQFYFILFHSNPFLFLCILFYPILFYSILLYLWQERFCRKIESQQLMYFITFNFLYSYLEL